ncbi:RING-like_zinc finger domain-containing protein [Hexamita inflata]|uniref:RING-like zinc finger domain-containing protein n=1 Tax=Hexamita inflata TaxID=28002 RepID=A0AA86P5C8_9EUKA|nr:RING-like zinc finger domain-containing protein [Hexamita inflata]CAI9928510.1 RING-like zinc finger domain-containing protein [Hexamita inflata]CAI9931143.1 RING-like zinc finger domain-containing protein [Hexamita inflata]
MLKKLMKQVDKDIVQNNKTYFKLNQERYGMKPPKILQNFTKEQQVKAVQEEKEFRKITNQPAIYVPSEHEWKIIERTVLARKERTCPACFCTFGAEAQLLTSCRHTFHEKCYLQFLQFNPQSKSTCLVCRQHCIIIKSEILLKQNYKLTIIYLQSYARRYLAYNIKNSLKLLSNGEFSSKLRQMTAMSDVVQQHINEEFDKGIYQFEVETERANQLFDEYLKLKDASIYKGVEKARKRQNASCCICYDDFNVKYIQWCDGPSEYQITSCCGSLFHKDCLEGAQIEQVLCVYCKQAYFTIPVSII